MFIQYNAQCSIYGSAMQSEVHWVMERRALLSQLLVTTLVMILRILMIIMMDMVRMMVVSIDMLDLQADMDLTADNVG